MEHILNIYEEQELEEQSSKREIGISDFSTKPTNFYNLDVIISVGYRVKSHQGTKFRQWATARLKESSEELNLLNRMVTTYLELAELQALNRKPMYMKDWIERLDDFLKMTGNEILQHAGTVRHLQA
jgi:hypothetical protein